MAPTQLPSPNGDNVDESLLQRLGGEANLELTIQHFYDLILNDPALEEFFGNTNMKLLRAHQKRFMVIAFTKIPEDFNVASFIVQKHYRLFMKGLNETHFDLVVEHLIAALKQMWVEQEEIDEIIEILGPFRDVFVKTAKSEQIVKHVAKHKRKQQEKELQQQRRLAAMGLGGSEDSYYESSEEFSVVSSYSTDSFDDTKSVESYESIRSYDTISSSGDRSSGEFSLRRSNRQNARRSLKLEPIERCGSGERLQAMHAATRATASKGDGKKDAWKDDTKGQVDKIKQRVQERRRQRRLAQKKTCTKRI